MIKFYYFRELFVNMKLGIIDNVERTLNTELLLEFDALFIIEGPKQDKYVI